MKQILVIIMIILPFISQGMNYSVGDTLNVVAVNGLVVRSAPGVTGEKITVLKANERVCIRDTSNYKNQQDSIFGFQGNWVLIQSADGTTGYVFDAFLSSLPRAKSFSESGNSLPKINEDYYGMLHGILKRYAVENFTQTACSFEYPNRYDGERAHSMKIQKFQEGHALIENEYWEAGSVELKLENVRLCEVYFLVHQFLDEIDEIIKISDYDLRHPGEVEEWETCVGKVTKISECLVEVYKHSNNSFTLTFKNLCPC